MLLRSILKRATTMQKANSSLCEISRFLSSYATCLMGVGAQTSRIEKNTRRIAEALGVKAEMTIFQKTLILTLLDQKTQTSYTLSGKKKTLPLNFEINARLSHLSWAAADKRLNLEETERIFRNICAKKRESEWIVNLLVSVANASFCRLFQGDFVSMIIVFVATFHGFFIKNILLKSGIGEYTSFILSAFCASLYGSLAYMLKLGTTPDVALGTSVLYLVPGVLLINGIMDVIDGYVTTGLSRLASALMLVVCIAIGLSATLFITGIATL